MKKRASVLTLICLGLLSSQGNVNAINLRHRSQNHLYNQINMMNMLRQNEQDSEAQDVADQQQTEVQATDAEVDAAQLEEAQAAQVAQEEAEAEPVAPAKPAKKVVAATPEINQAAALAAAAEELYPDVNKMTAAQKKTYMLKKQREAIAEKKAKKEKEALENPTVDANGEHIQTVAEAKELARQLQAQLEAGEQAVEEKIALQQQELANAPPEQVAAEEAPADDGHEETVEEVKAKMKALQAGMEEGIAATDSRIANQNKEMGEMPDFGALANLHGSIANMSKNRKKTQALSLAEKLGVELGAGEENLEASELTQTLISRAKEAGKTTDEINASLAD